jgi:pilus assembly protein CpaF
LESVTNHLASYMRDGHVSEVHVRGSSGVVLVRSTPPDLVLPSPFASQQLAHDWIQEFAWGHRQRLDLSRPEAGGVTDTGWRWHAVIAPLSQEQPLLMLRRQRFNELCLRDFFDPNDFLPGVLSHVNAGRPLLVVGPTGAGKSSLLVAILKQLALSERLIILETIREIPALTPCWSFLMVNPLQQDLSLNTALRLSPTRFVFGEIREGDFELFVKSIYTGHGGTLATVHGSDASDVWRRSGSLLNQVPNLGLVVVHRTPMPTLVEFTAYPSDQRWCG